MISERKPTVVDLFCGAGGLSTGFEYAGFNIIMANDENRAACETYSINHPHTPLFKCDIKELPYFELFNDSHVDVIIGGPPCKPYSNSYKNRKSAKLTLHPDSELYKEFIRIVEHIRPKMFVMENVSGLMEVLDDIAAHCNNLGYELKWQVLNMAFYGLPQERERIFIVGLEKGLTFNFPNPSIPNPKDWISVADAISDLPEIPSNKPCFYKTPPQSQYQKLVRENSIFVHNHQVSKHRPETIERISYISPGGNWKDVPIRLLQFKNTNNTHNNIYRRLSWEGQAPTIEHIRKTMLIHPQYNRILTVREGARIQGFKDNYVFYGNITELYQQVADSVPPLFAQQLASQVLSALTRL